MSPAINLEGRRVHRQPFDVCTHVYMQESVLGPKKTEKCTFWESLTFFSLLLVALLLSSWVHCRHLVVEVRLMGS